MLEIFKVALPAVVTSPVNKLAPVANPPPSATDKPLPTFVRFNAVPKVKVLAWVLIVPPICGLVSVNDKVPSPPSNKSPDKP